MATTNDHTPDQWRTETPILIEALAAAADTSEAAVCEHLESNVVDDLLTEKGAVLQFIDEYISA